MTVTGALALGVTGIAGAGTTPGDTVHVGTTADGVTVKLTVAEFGNATAFKIGKTKVACGAGTLTNRGGTYTPLDTSDPGEFFDVTKSSSDNGGFHFKSKATIHGLVNADNTSWSGTFKLVTKVFQRGERIDLCKLNTTWDVA